MATGSPHGRDSGATPPRGTAAPPSITLTPPTWDEQLMLLMFPEPFAMRLRQRLSFS